MSLAYLTGREILKMQEAGRLSITPFDPAQVAQSSIDFHLSPHMFMYAGGVLDFAEPSDDCFEMITITSEGYVLMPGMYFNACTIERFHSPEFDIKAVGASSPARLSVSIENAGLVERGFCGPITLEITTVVPVRIYPGVKIGQAMVYRPFPEIDPALDSESYRVRGNYTDANDCDEPKPQLSRTWKQPRRHYKGP